MTALNVFIPPVVAATIQLLAAHGHSVTVRQNRNGSNRYRLDGGRELQAIELMRFYERKYEARAA